MFGLLVSEYVGPICIVETADCARAGAIEDAGGCAGGAATLEEDVAPAPFPLGGEECPLLWGREEPLPDAWRRALP